MTTQIARLTPKQSDRLESLAISINAELAHAHSLARQSIEKYLAVGMHLLEARSMFPGDKEFGQWAADQLPEVQKRWRTSLMAVARKFVPILEQEDSSGQPAARNLLMMLPVSTLNEMVPASDETIDIVVARLRNGERVTKREVREIVTSAKASIDPSTAPSISTARDGGATVAASSESGGHVPIPPSAREDEAPVASNRDGKVILDVPSVDTRMLSLLTLPIAERVKHTNDPFIIFGLNPFTDHPMVNLETLEVLYNLYIQACDEDEGDCATITEAYEKIRDETESVTVAQDLSLVAYRYTEGYYDDAIDVPSFLKPQAE